jgi:glucose-6-phosphate-specific signal transduction histidine kinase
MLLLVPIFKGIGLVVLLFIVNPLLIDFLFIRKSIQVFKAKINWRRISRVVAANIIVSAVVYSLLYFVGISYVLMLLLGFAGFIILYPIILGIIGGISTDDINLITRVSKGIPVIGSVIIGILKYTAVFVRISEN